MTLVIVSGFEPLAYRLGASKEQLKTLKGRHFWATPSYLKPLLSHFLSSFIQYLLNSVLRDFNDFIKFFLA